jgi:GNAT superfamily N-acetyltransferase
LALFGVLTAVSGGKRGLEGEAAFVVFWLVAAPLAIAVLQFAQVRREVSDRALVPAGVSAALIVCFGAGALSGSTVVADLALAAALLAGGAATRISVLTLCGLGVGASTAALGALGASAALVTAATGLVLLACGALAERTGWPAVRPARDRGRSSKEVDRAAAEVCAAAFDKDPAMVALVPRSRSRRQAMLRLWFRGLLRIARRFAGRQPEIVCSAGEVSAVCVVFEPDHYPPPSWTTAIAAPGPLRGGLRAAIDAGRWLAAREAQHPDEPHLYVETLATTPERQGQGIGSTALRELCREADRRSLPILLHTNNRENISWYARFGFEVIRAMTLPHGAPEWLLRRPSS